MQKIKYIIAVLFIFNFINSNAQSTTSKYNNLTNRYEYFNSNGDLTGYKTYNSLQQQWEYFEVKTEPRYNKVQPAYNIEQLSETMNSLNNRFDNNAKRVQDAIDKIVKDAYALNLNEDVKLKINKRFDNEFIQAINRKTISVNYESNTTTSNLVTWLYNGINKIIREEQLKQIPENDEVLEFIKYHGGYIVPKLNEYILENGIYKLIKTEYDGNFMYYRGNEIYFKRGFNSDWKVINLTFKMFNQYMNTYSYTTPYGSIFIDKDFKMLIIIEDLQDGSTKKYEYLIGNYDKNIIPKND